MLLAAFKVKSTNASTYPFLCHDRSLNRELSISLHLVVNIGKAYIFAQLALKTGSETIFIADNSLSIFKYQFLSIFLINNTSFIN